MAPAAPYIPPMMQQSANNSVNEPVPPLQIGSLNQASSKNLLVNYEVATVRDYSLSRYRKEATPF